LLGKGRISVWGDVLIQLMSREFPGHFELVGGAATVFSRLPQTNPSHSKQTVSLIVNSSRLLTIFLHLQLAVSHGCRDRGKFNSSIMEVEWGILYNDLKSNN